MYGALPDRGNPKAGQPVIFRANFRMLRHGLLKAHAGSAMGPSWSEGLTTFCPCRLSCMASLSLTTTSLFFSEVGFGSEVLQWGFSCFGFWLTDTRCEWTQFHGSSGKTVTWAEPSFPLKQTALQHRASLWRAAWQILALFTVEQREVRVSESETQIKRVTFSDLLY